MASSRKEAQLNGENTFYTGKPCSNGHLDYRYTQSGACRSCINGGNSKKFDVTLSKLIAAKREEFTKEFAKIRLDFDAARDAAIAAKMKAMEEACLKIEIEYKASLCEVKPEPPRETPNLFHFRMGVYSTDRTRIVDMIHTKCLARDPTILRTDVDDGSKGYKHSNPAIRTITLKCFIDDYKDIKKDIVRITMETAEKVEDKRENYRGYGNDSDSY